MLEKVKNSKLVQASFWYTIGNVFIKGINFITIPLYTNLMSVDEYGQINNFLSISAIVGIFVGLSLQGSINNANFDYKDKMHEYMSSVLFLSTLSFIGFFLLGNVMYLFNTSYLSITHEVFVFLIIQAYSVFLVNYLGAYFTINVQYFRFLILSFLNVISNVGFSILFMVTFFNDDRYIGRVVGGTVGVTVLAIAIYILIMTKGKKLINKKYWKYGLAISLPLIPHTLSQNILSTFDRTMINNMIGNYEAGIYSYILNLGIVLSVLWASTNSAWVPWFYNELKHENYDKIKKTANIYAMIFAVVTIIVMVLMIDVAKLLAPAAYQIGIPLVIPVLLGFYFQFLYSLPVNTEFYLKKTNYIALGTIMSAGIKILLNYIFIPLLGFESAAFTTVISYFFLFAFHYILSNKLLGRTLFDTKVLLLITAAVCLISLFLYVVIDFILLRYLVLVALIIMAFTLRKKIPIF